MGESKAVETSLSSAFVSGDKDQDGLLDRLELRALALPEGWDGHLARRDLHALGLFLHTWLATDEDWHAVGLFTLLDTSGDDAVSQSEWTNGMLQLHRDREVATAIAQLTAIVQ